MAERRGEVDRHLEDMRSWYRRKIRELSGIDADPTPAGKEFEGRGGEEGEEGPNEESQVSTPSSRCSCMLPKSRRIVNWATCSCPWNWWTATPCRLCFWRLVASAAPCGSCSWRTAT